MGVAFGLQLGIHIYDTLRLIDNIHRNNIVFVTFVMKQLVPSIQSFKNSQFCDPTVIFTSEKIIKRLFDCYTVFGFFKYVLILSATHESE